MIRAKLKRLERKPHEEKKRAVVAEGAKLAEEYRRLSAEWTAAERASILRPEFRPKEQARVKGGRARLR